jgi:hypothetical protein
MAGESDRGHDRAAVQRVVGLFHDFVNVGMFAGDKGIGTHSVHGDENYFVLHSKHAPFLCFQDTVAFIIAQRNENARRLKMKIAVLNKTHKDLCKNAVYKKHFLRKVRKICKSNQLTILFEDVKIRKILYKEEKLWIKL